MKQELVLWRDKIEKSLARLTLKKKKRTQTKSNCKRRNYKWYNRNTKNYETLWTVIYQ